MCRMELATRTITAETRTGSHSDVTGTIVSSVWRDCTRLQVPGVSETERLLVSGWSGIGHEIRDRCPPGRSAERGIARPRPRLERTVPRRRPIDATDGARRDRLHGNGPRLDG